MSWDSDFDEPGFGCPDDEETAVIERVYVGATHVGHVYTYASHCEGVPVDPGVSHSYRFHNAGDAAHWLRMLHVSVSAAEVWRDQHAIPL